jgi:hypothetical protein
MKFLSGALSEDKIELITNLLKPATVEYRFAMINPQSMNVSISDLKIIIPHRKTLDLGNLKPLASSYNHMLVLLHRR